MEENDTFSIATTCSCGCECHGQCYRSRWYESGKELCVVVVVMRKYSNKKEVLPIYELRTSDVLLGRTKRFPNERHAETAFCPESPKLPTKCCCGSFFTVNSHHISQAKQQRTHTNLCLLSNPSIVLRQSLTTKQQEEELFFFIILLERKELIFIHEFRSATNSATNSKTCRGTAVATFTRNGTITAGFFCHTTGTFYEQYA